MFKPLPRWNKDSLISHDDLNALAEAIEQQFSFTVDSASLNFHESTTARVLRAVAQRVAGYAIVNQAITAASGAKLGMGTIDLQTKDAAGNLSPYGGPSEDCYNSTLATVASGSVIQVKWIEDDWAVDVNRCS